MSEALTVRGSADLTQQDSIRDTLQLAIEKGVPVEGIERLVGLYERMADRAARDAFYRALAEFQRLCPEIERTSLADFVTRQGQRVTYRYAELDEIVRTVRPHLHAVGLSYTWDTTVADKLLTSTCVLRHIDGHSERATFSCPVEGGSPAMSEQQKYASAGTFARRQSLVGVLGLTLTDPVLDGSYDRTPISEEQAVQLEDMLTEGKVSRARFLKFLGEENTPLKEIPAAKFDVAVNMLQKRIAERS